MKLSTTGDEKIGLAGTAAPDGSVMEQQASLLVTVALEWQ